MFRVTPRATSRVQQYTSPIMASENVILITLNLISLFSSALVLFSLQISELQKFCFLYTCANNVFLQIKLSKFYFHFCAQKVRFYCARVPRIFGFSRTDPTDIKRVKIGVSDNGKILFSILFRLQQFRKIVSKSTNL